METVTSTTVNDIYHQITSTRGQRKAFLAGVLGWQTDCSTLPSVVPALQKLPSSTLPLVVSAVLQTLFFPSSSLESWTSFYLNKSVLSAWSPILFTFHHEAFKKLMKPCCSTNNDVQGYRQTSLLKCWFNPDAQEKSSENQHHIVDLLECIASQGIGGGKDKVKQFAGYEDKIIMNSKEDIMFGNISKDMTNRFFNLFLSGLIAGKNILNIYIYIYIYRILMMNPTCFDFK